MNEIYQAALTADTAFENALRDVERLGVSVRLGFDPGTEEIRDARFDVLHDELKLLKPPV